jgi:hypothetical protein
MNNTIILIPVYKSTLNETEILSLTQCFKVLGKHRIVFVAPLGLDFHNYQKYINQQIEVEYFNASFFASIRGYNQLMLSEEFYSRFLRHTFMLIYQLDCYVFRDELEYWCSKGYDYIGAPWLDYSYYNLSKWSKLFFHFKRIFILKNKLDRMTLVNRVGNGGLSLRHIDKFYRCLKFEQPDTLKKFSESDDTTSLYNEDVYWSLIAKNIKKPNYKVACKFSIDSGVNIGLAINNGKLPFGCHGWNKKYEYWKKYICD